ncbi:MAG TPA: NAD(P)-binding protein [Chitinophagaceae bacterium]|nr:NAD(P)-binding protein [Chitinophagaceae bacterium]
MNKHAIIIGAGPAGLTAAYELLKRTEIKPIILEKSGDIGGISKTVQYKGNRIDIGGHRFFSKSDRVMNWWMNIMPVQAEAEAESNITIHYQNASREIKTDTGGVSIATGKDSDKVMLVRKRLSRIYFLRKFFTYPIQLSFDTLTKLGPWTTITIILSYLKAQLFSRKPERNLEDFMINRFGQVLYKLFFKDYTEKVWGIPCNAISAEWGAQRIKGISIRKAIEHAIKSSVKGKHSGKDNIAQKDIETSLIEQFLYPKYGPGQLWEEVARQIQEMGGTILMHHDVKRIYTSETSQQVTAISAINTQTGDTSYLEGDYFFSTMPIQELIEGMDGSIPDAVKHVAAGLQYRDFITVGILLKKLSFQDKKTGEWKPISLKDTWIYIQEKDVKVGRLQLFNNWSPYMVKDPDTVWVGMEFFCNTEDNFWKLTDEEIKQLAITELEKIGLASSSNVLDATVLRMEKTYPAYFGTYDQFDEIRSFIDKFQNLFLIGRNGMHKYNNSDHSMLTAMVAVDNIKEGIVSKHNLWSINTEQDYHETKIETAISAKTTNMGKISSYSKPQPAMQDSGHTSFYKYLGVKENKIALVIIFLLLAVQLTVFKVLFPFANYLPDSYSYIEAAWINAPVSMWPIGYSKFLRVFSAFFRSDLALVSFQYFILETAILYFVYTVFYFTKPSAVVKYIILFALIINPLFLLTSNYISSDTLFTSLSLIWVTQLLWMLLKPRRYQIYIHAFALVLAFTIRYNALYYPLISVVILVLCKFSWRLKLEAIGLAVGLLALFIWHSENNYSKISGKRQFSAFGGWQLAANALYAYSRIPDRNTQVPPNLAELHNYTKHFIDSISSMKHRPDSVLGVYYLWDGPLIGYLNQKYKKDSTTPYFKKYALLAPLYLKYGQTLIKSHPADYTKYFLLTNILRYYAPPTEFLSQYNMQSDTVRQTAKEWFDYKSTKVTGYAKTLPVIMAYSVFFALINICFFGCIIGFMLFHGIKKVSYAFLACLGISVSIWVVNLFFSVLASPIVLRYQIFTTVLLFVVSVYLIDFIARIDNIPAQKGFPVHYQLPKLAN